MLVLLGHCDVWLTRLTDPAFRMFLYLTKGRFGENAFELGMTHGWLSTDWGAYPYIRRLPLHAWSPRVFDGMGQLPSPPAYSLEGFIWYNEVPEIPISHKGLEPHKLMPMTGVPIKCEAVRDIRR